MVSGGSDYTDELYQECLEAGADAAKYLSVALGNGSMGEIDRRPNILLLLTDQERYDVSSPGGPAIPDCPDIETPNIDRLREEGMEFNRMYTPISICSSARASLMTGLYPHNHEMLNNCHEPDAIKRENLSPNHATFSELLKDEGYYNSYIGKWHVGKDQNPQEFGFHYFLDGTAAREKEEFKLYRREAVGVDPEDIELQEQVYTKGPEPILIAAKLTAPDAELAQEAALPYYLAEKTIEHLERIAEEPESTAEEELIAEDEDAGDEASTMPRQPFFHRTDFEGPHHPYIVPEPYASKYDPDEIEPWPSFMDTFDGKPHARKKYRANRGVDHMDWDDWAPAVAKYFGFVDFIDDQIGRVLDKVDELIEDGKLSENTVVMHTADHGDMTGSYGLFNKGPHMYEPTYHIPLQVRWPDVIEPGTTCDDYVRLMDLMPTFLDVAGADIPEEIDGRSILPLMKQETPVDWPDSVFLEYNGDEFGLYTQRGVRTDDYKFIYNGPDTNELYDLTADPHELNNVIDDPEYADVHQEMVDLLISWMNDTDDLYPWIIRSLQRSVQPEAADQSADLRGGVETHTAEQEVEQD